MNACAFPDGVLHDHGNAQCHEATYQAGRRDALTPQPLAPALTTHVDLGAVWIERDGQQVRVDADELLPLVRSLLFHLDALGDAR
ncbi:hypothetical protein [Nocardioides soli]|uniref:Uncharacterized protein n=1 Tax=Nocardioides soli TaxID=1036020 RepID=A0A7W4VSJ2_9ACTN|nr:hypothetical protein [Nocardioides soli]MBB3040976.1 hypothetical protein [Nocardioides soli]